MPTLGQIIRAIQHDAAALPTDVLRDEIGISLEVLDAVISQFYSIRPGVLHVDERITATGDVMIAALTVALFIRELATRPVDRFAVVVSPN